MISLTRTLQAILSLQDMMFTYMSLVRDSLNTEYYHLEELNIFTCK